MFGGSSLSAEEMLRPHLLHLLQHLPPVKCPLYEENGETLNKYSRNECEKVEKTQERSSLWLSVSGVLEHAGERDYKNSLRCH